MKLRILLAFLLFSATTRAQETAPTPIRAPFIFFQENDTVDMKRAEIKVNQNLRYQIQSKRTFKKVFYHWTLATPTAGVAAHSAFVVVSTDGTLDFNAFRNIISPGYKLSLELDHLEDEKGAKFKPSKSTYNFTFR